MKRSQQGQPQTSLEAVEQIRKTGDTLDVYAPRIRRTTTTVTRPGVILGPTAAMEMFNNGWPGLEYVVTAPVYMTALTGVAGVLYGAQRYREKGKLGRAEAAQQVIRKATNEPVDVLRIGKRRNRELALWWRGADGTEVQNLRYRYDALVQYAEANGLDRVVVSASVLKGLADDDLEKYGNVIGSKNFFKSKQGKRVNLKDRKAPEQLLSSDLQEAKLLVEALKQEEAKDPFVRIAKRLSIADPEHKFKTHFDAWIKFNRNPALKAKIIDELRRSLEARHSARADMVAGTRVDRMEVRVQSTLTTKGLEQIVSATNADNGQLEYQNANSTPRKSLLHDKDPSRFILELSKRPMQQFLADDVETCEYALYLLLTNQINVAWVKNQLKNLKTEDGEQGAALKVGATSGTLDTFLQRLKKEAPRTAFWTRKHGRNGNSIEYGKHAVLPRAQKIAAAALAIGLGGGLGYMATQWQDYFFFSAPYCTEEQKKEAAEKGDNDPQCRQDRQHYLDTHPYLKGADAVYEFHADIEDGILLDLYKKKILDFETLATVDNYLSDEWKEKKKDDLAKLASLVHIEGSAPIGVNADPTKEGASNPPMWTIDNRSSHSAEGYWYEGVYSDFTVHQGVANEILPYSDVGLAVNDHYRFMRDDKNNIMISIDDGDTYQHVRNVPLESMSQIETRNDVMIVTGRQDNAIEWSYALNSDKRAYMLTIPVLEGADVVGAEVSIRNYEEDGVLSSLDARVIQLPDGTFKLVVPEYKEKALEDPGYYDIKFAIKPQADTALPTRAILPARINPEPGRWPVPLADVITEEDVAGIRAKLGVGPQASAEEIAAAFKDKYGYDYGPYEGKQGTEKGADVPVREAVVKIVEEAVDLEDINCTIPASSTIIAERGEDGGRILSYAVGARQDKSGKEKISHLERSKAHALIVTSEGTKIDGTPTARNQNQSTPETTEAEQELPGSKLLDNTIVTGKVILGAAAAFGGFAGGRSTFSSLVVYTRRRRREYVAGYIDREMTNRPTRLQDDVAVLEHLLYSASGSHLDSNNLSVHLQETDEQVVRRRIENLPTMTTDELEQVITMRQQDGRVTITEQGKRRLAQLIDAKVAS